MKSPQIAVGLALLLAAAYRAEPSPSDTDKRMGQLARQIQEELKQLGQADVGVDGFTDTGRLESSAGPMIQSRLMDELKKLGVGLEPKARYYLTGEFLPDKKAPEGQLGLKLVCTLREQPGEEVKKFTATLGYKSNEDLVKLFALSVDLTEQAKATPKERNEALKKQKDDPPAYTKKDEIKVRAGSPFAVKLLAAKAGGEEFEYRPGKVEDGTTRVTLAKGEEYRLELCNDSKHEIAVTVTVDGVDAFEFFTPREGRPTSFLVAPGKVRLVKGWKFSTEADKAFLVGSLADSAAAKLYKPSESVGTITVCIHPAWEKGKTPPEYEGGRDIGTGVGRPIPDETKVIEREIGPLLEAISIRYKK